VMSVQIGFTPKLRQDPSITDNPNAIVHKSLHKTYSTVH